MNQFTFESKYKTVLLGFMALGLLCLVGSYLVSDELGTRFWTNFLHNSAFFTGIALMSLFVMAAFVTAWSGWHTLIKRIWEAYALFLIPGLVLMLIIIAGLWGHFHHLYHWADAESVAQDPILQGKSAFLNNGWYTFGTLLIVGLWIVFAVKLRQLSLQEDQYGTPDFEHHRKIRVWSAGFLPAAGFLAPAIVWLWLMSIDAHWYSTLYAWYVMASWFVSALALTILTIIFLKAQGYLEYVTADHLHDLGKYMFAFSIFWTYLWFSQYMLIWYGNVGEETVYYHERLENYPVLFYGNLLMNFVAPFFILMRNDNKRKVGTMVFAAVVIFFGHWWDFFQMIKPGALHTAHEVLEHHGHGAAEHGHGAAEAAHHASTFVAGFTMPGLLEIGIMLGFLAGFFYFVFHQLSKASLVPANDPYLAESKHHEVWPY